MTTPRPTTTALCAVLDAEAAWLCDQFATLEANRKAIKAGSLWEMRVATDYVRDRSVFQRGQIGHLGDEAAARHPLVVDEIDGIIAALRDVRRGGGAR